MQIRENFHETVHAGEAEIERGMICFYMPAIIPRLMRISIHPSILTALYVNLRPVNHFSQLDLSSEIQDSGQTVFQENKHNENMSSISFQQYPASSLRLPPAITAPSKTTVTAFGPILRTAVNLPQINSGMFFQQIPSIPNQPIPIVPFGSTGKQLPAGPSMYMPMEVSKTSQVPKQPASSKKTVRRPSEIIRKILANEESSDDSDTCEAPVSAPAAQVPVGTSRVLLPPTILTTGPSPISPIRPPAGVGLTPSPHRIDRISKKMEELEKVQQFIEESRAVRERIHANFDLSRATNVVGLLAPPRPSAGMLPTEQDLQSSHRSLSQTQEANNIAELRRNIAEKYASKKSPMKPPVRNETPSPIRPPAAAPTGDGIVSGVFVSYPRRRSTSAPPSREEQSPVGGNVLSQFRAATATASGKMTAEEYARLRKNLLDHSEQHAVTSLPPC